MKKHRSLVLLLIVADCDFQLSNRVLDLLGGGVELRVLCLTHGGPHPPSRAHTIKLKGVSVNKRKLSRAQDFTLWSISDIFYGVGAMSNEITFQDITGDSVSGHFEVSEGLITVTLSDGTKTSADIQESMLGPETLARMLLLKMHRAKQTNGEDLLEE
jgi:hypothetical protein